MVSVKLKNVSIKNGQRYRNNQNYSMTFSRIDDGINENSSINDIRKLIISKYSDKVILNKSSQIEIVSVSC